MVRILEKGCYRIKIDYISIIILIEGGPHVIKERKRITTEIGGEVWFSEQKWRKEHSDQTEATILSVYLEWLLSNVGPHLYWGASGEGCSFLFGSNFDHVAPTPRKSINGGGIASEGSLCASSLCSATDDSEPSLPNICAVEFEKP